MTSRQKSKLSMNQVVLAFLTANLEIVKKVEVFFNYYTKLQVNVSQIEAVGGHQQKNITGVTIDKNQQRIITAEEGLIISSALCSLASATGNNTLHKKVYFTPSSIDKYGDEDALLFLRNVLEEALLHKDELKANAITDETISQYQQSVADLAAALSTPALAGKGRKTSGITLEDLFKENADLHKKKMLPSARVYKKTNPDFYTKYVQCTRSRDPLTRSTQTTGIITDKTSGKPLESVTVRAEGTGFSTISTRTGKYKLKISDAGTYTFVFEKEGYLPVKMDNTAINTGQSLVADIQLQKAS